MGFGIGSRGEKRKDVLGYGSVARGEIIVLAFNANTLQTHLKVKCIYRL